MALNSSPQLRFSLVFCIVVVATHRRVGEASAATADASEAAIYRVVSADLFHNHTRSLFRRQVPGGGEVLSPASAITEDFLLNDINSSSAASTLLAGDASQQQQQQQQQKFSKSFRLESLLLFDSNLEQLPPAEVRRDARALPQLAPGQQQSSTAAPTIAPKKVKYGNNAPYTETQILDLLFQNYDKRVRPAGLTANGTKGPVYVEVNVMLRSISKVDDVKMEYTAQITFREMWKDERLAFDDGGYHQYLTLPDIGKVWKPDLFFYPEKEGWFHKIVTPNWMFRIYPDGTVLYSVRLSLVLSCFMRLHYYPMDRQNCTIDMASYAYTTKDIVFQWRNDSPVQIKNIHLPQFTLEKWEVSECTTVTNTGGYSCIQVTLFFRREFSYYLLQVYVPTIMLVIVSWVSFWLDQDAIPARITLGVTTLLTMATSQSGINAALPPVSYTKAIDIWTGTCTLLIFGALLEFALVNYASRKESAREKRKHQILMAKRARRMDVEMALAANEHGSFASPYDNNGLDGANNTIKLLDDAVRPNIGGAGVLGGGEISFDTTSHGPLLRGSLPALSRSASNAGTNNNTNITINTACACDERGVPLANANNSGGAMRQHSLFMNAQSGGGAYNRRSIAELAAAANSSGVMIDDPAQEMYNALLPGGGGGGQHQPLQLQLSGGGLKNSSPHHSIIPQQQHHGGDEDDEEEMRHKGTWCWGLLHNKMCWGYINVPKSKARKIDYVSRLLFPLIFFIFNIAYWTHCYEQRLDTNISSH